MVQSDWNRNGGLGSAVQARTWIANCSLGEYLGMAIAGTTMFLHQRFAGEPETPDEKVFVLAVMLLAGVAEGALIGVFQWRVLKKALPGLSAKSWIGVTILAALLGWGLGMIPGMNAEDPTALEPPFVLMLAGGAGMGVVLGALFGMMQNMVLKHFVPNQWQWITYNAAGWGLAMIWIFLGAGIVGIHWPVWAVVLTAALAGALAGLSVGMITSFFLSRKKVIVPLMKN